MQSETEYKRARVSSVRHFALQLQGRNSLKTNTRTMKTFALLCFLLLASACVFVARAEEETAVEEPKTEDQPEVAADEEQPEEETKSDEEETEADEDNEDEEDEEDETTDVADDEQEKRSGYYPKCTIHLRCKPVCRRKTCTRRICKRVKCGSRKVCRYIVKYRIVKYKYKIPYSYDGYGPTYGIKIRKIPYKIPICHLIPKHCTRCHRIRYICGKICHKVCQKYKKCNSYY